MEENVMKKHVIDYGLMGLCFSLALLVGGCSSGQVKMGDESAKSTATGYAGGSSATGENSGLEHCVRPVGTMSVYEDVEAEWHKTWIANMRGDRTTTSIVPVIRLLAQQSNCFAVVERGRAMNAMARERGLMDSGELREHSNFGKGQMAAADYTLEPNIILSSNDVGGIGGTLGGMLPGSWGSIGADIGGKMKFKDSQSILTLIENRSGIQVASAEGSASAKDAGGLLGMLSGGGGGALSAYTKTPEGKVIVGSITDAYNNLVKAVKSYKAQESASPYGHGTGGSLQVN